jgi:molybdopterin-dependent oxidoreductase alpha subunit
MAEHSAADSQALSMASPSANPSANPSVDKGGGLPIIQYWAEQTLSPKGPQLWKVLNHKSACLSCAWGTGGQKGGFVNEAGEYLQRCMKSVESIAAELQPGIDPNHFVQQRITDLQDLTSLEADQLGRLSFPMILRQGSSHYERISWEEVFTIATAAFRQPPERVASYSSGRSSNEAAFLLQLMMRALGSNNLADCSDLCHAASTVGLRDVFGSSTSMVSLEDLHHSDCVVLIGSNAPANHPRLLNELIQVRERGGSVLVINPVREVGLVKFASPAFPIKSLFTGSEIASLYLQPIPGSDVAVFVGIQKALIERGQVNWTYLQQHTQNWQVVVEQAQTTSWEAVTSTCGVSQAELEKAADLIAQAERVVFAWAMGVTQQTNGVDNIYSITNTALMTGNAGKIGAGTMPIRGHSNVQGFGSMGVTIHLRKEIQESLERLLGQSLSHIKGYDTRALIEAADADKVDTLICLGGNLFAANPDAKQAKRALSQIDTIIYLATKPNLGHFHGLARQQTIVIPVFARFENPHRTTVESGNNFVRFNDAGKTHLKQADLISEVAFITELASRLHGTEPVDWCQLQDTKYVRQLIAKTIPGYGQLANIDDSKQEFTIAGRIFHEPKFPTATGRAQLFATPLPQLSLPSLSTFALPATTQGLVLALMTGRSYAQHNTVVYKVGDRYRGMPHRHCILMSPQDAAQMGWSEHQRVTVRGDTGQLEGVEIIFGEVRPGAALMFYPEVNVLFSAQIDPRSGTPAFKRVPVAVYTEALSQSA